MHCVSCKAWCTAADSLAARHFDEYRAWHLIFQLCTLPLAELTRASL